VSGQPLVGMLRGYQEPASDPFAPLLEVLTRHAAATERLAGAAERTAAAAARQATAVEHLLALAQVAQEPKT
jgi:hypothetical protein